MHGGLYLLEVPFGRGHQAQSFAVPKWDTCVPCRLSRLTALAFDMHASPKPDGGAGSALLSWTGGFPVGLCRLSQLTELDMSLRAFNRPIVVLPEVRASALVGLSKTLRNSRASYCALYICCLCTLRACEFGGQ